MVVRLVMAMSPSSWPFAENHRWCGRYSASIGTEVVIGGSDRIHTHIPSGSPVMSNQ